MEKFLISIIIPVYNTEKYLPKCLDSIMAQAYQNWEAIIVDDGSKDTSGKICDEYVAKDKRFKVIHKQNEGVSISRLTAFEHCSGEFVLFVDSDDYIADNMLQQMYDYVNQYEVDMVVCGFYDVYEDKIIKNKQRKLAGYFDRDGINNLKKTKLIYDYTIGMPPVIEGLARRMVRKKFLSDTLVKSKGYWLGEDAMCNFYLYEIISSMYICHDPLYYYVHRNGAATQSNPYKIWNGLIKLFDGILNLNQDGIYDGQLAGRILIAIRWCMSNAYSLSFSDFRSFIKYIQDSTYVKSYLLNNKVENLCLFKDKFANYIVKSKMYLINFMLVKLYFKLKKSELQ